MGQAKETWRDIFIEDMQEIGVSGSGTLDEARSTANDHSDRDNSSPSVPEGREGPKPK